MKAVGLVLAALLMWTVSGWLSMQDTVSAAAPEGTVLALRFTPGRGGWDQVERTLGQIPLISNRPITTEGLRPFTQGEFALFVSADGTRSVAIHASKAALPRAELDALGIMVSEVHPNVFLLSDRPLATSGVKMKWSFTLPPAPWQGFSRIGTAYVADADASGPVYATPFGLEIRLRNLALAKPSGLPVPNDAVAVLSTPLLPNIDFDWLIKDIEIQTEALGAPSTDTFKQLLGGTGGVVLTKGGGFLVVMNAANFDLPAQKNLLRLAAAMQSPTKTPWILPDNSQADEILVDPSSVTVEEATVQGTDVLRVHGKNGNALSSASKDGHFALTNDDALLESWLAGSATKPNGPCGSSILSLDVRAANENALRAPDGWRPLPIGLLSEQLSMFSLNTEWQQTKLDLCH
jgi:hypothetical protein